MTAAASAATTTSAASSHRHGSGPVAPATRSRRSVGMRRRRRVPLSALEATVMLSGWGSGSGNSSTGAGPPPSASPAAGRSPKSGASAPPGASEIRTAWTSGTLRTCRNRSPRRRSGGEPKTRPIADGPAPVSAKLLSRRMFVSAVGAATNCGVISPSLPSGVAAGSPAVVTRRVPSSLSR